MKTEINNKPELIFIPHYMGSLRYYEKFRSFLTDKYDIAFLLLPLDDGKYLREMRDFCEKEKIRIYTVTQVKANPIFKNFPFYRELKQARLYKREIKELFKNKNIKKIISVNDCGFPLGYLLAEARKKGIDTMVLQWALFSSGQNFLPVNVSKNLFRRMVFKYGKPVYERVRERLYGLILGEKLKILKDTLGSGSSEKFGVINKNNLDRLALFGVPKKKMSIVGYMDFHLTETTKNTLDRDRGKKAEIAEQLGIDLAKKNIIIFSSSYNSDVVRTMNDSEQLNFYWNIVDLIYQICPSNHFQISLKIHPRENIALYKPLIEAGVKLYDKHTDNFQLIYFSDLYIADSTTANFIPIIMDKNAIFINFARLELIEKSKTDFLIRQFVTDKFEFKNLLMDFKNNKLEKQYDFNENILTKNSLVKILEWIG